VGTEARAGDSAAAEAMFGQGKQLMAAGRYAEACPKLEESQRLDPGMGTLFNLAECDERIGKSASAWAAYLEVAAQARAARQPDREKVARERAAALEPRLARVTVVTTAAERTAGLQVKRNDVAVGKGQWGAPVPVDPGEYTIVATAPGKLAWERKISVPASGRVSVDVPALRDAPVAAAAPGAPVETTQAMVRGPGADTSSSFGAQRVGAVVVGVVGLAGLGVGTYFAVASKTDRDDASAHCNGNQCDATGVALRDDAIRNGNGATIAYGVGAAAVVGSVVLWLTAPRSRETIAKTGRSEVPTVGLSPAGMTVRGTF
jgi:serine/threonine-protein kinase